MAPYHPELEFSRIKTIPYLDGSIEKVYSSYGYPVEMGLDKIWFKNKDGQIHRDDGPAEIIFTNRFLLQYARKLGMKNKEVIKFIKKEYKENPTIEIPHSIVWYQNGQMHRSDGPALLSLNTENFRYRELWYFNGISINDKAKSFLQKHSIDWRCWTTEEKFRFQLEVL